nr:PocR ligand-binding domain-containing protein [uncultured Acetatifactor sp.]
MHISDFMDLSLLQEIQDRFSDATGLAAIAVDAQGRYLTEGSNFTDFCMKYTRASKVGNQRCVKCDNECTGTYYCHAGLMDFSNDIIVDGVKVGAMIGGQVLPTEPDENKFRDIAKELGIDENAYVQAVRKVPVRSEKAIRAAAEFLGIVVNQMVNLEYLKSRDTKRLKTFDDGLQSATDSVEAIRNNTRKLDDISTKQNILSLNASIEAARAGMTGAGFAVVAKQMGDLSQQSKTIYQEIERLSEEIYATVSKMNKN